MKLRPKTLKFKKWRGMGCPAGHRGYQRTPVDELRRNALYESARRDAQTKADSLGMDVGLEWLDGPIGGWHNFVLPAPQYRQGHELECEVVSPIRLRSQPGA